MAAQPGAQPRRDALALLKRLAGPALLGLAAAAAALIVARDGTRLLQQPLHLDLRLVLLASLIVVAAQLLCALVWRQVLQAFGIRRPLRDDVRFYFYSAVSASIPGGFWVLASRSALYSRLGVSSLRVAVAATLESFVIGIAAIGVYAVTTVVQPSISLWRHPVLGFACGILAFGLLQPRVFNALCRWALKRSGISDEGLVVNFNIGRLLGWCAIEAGVLVVGGGVLYILLRSMLDAPLPVMLQLTAAWAAAAAAGNLLFFLPGVSLLRDGALVLALTPGLPLPVAVLFAVLSHAWSIATLLASAGIAWLIFELPGRLKSARRT